MVEAGGDKDPPTTVTTGATSAAALTIMKNLPETAQQHTKGERGVLVSQTGGVNLDLTSAEKSNLT